MLGVYVGEDGDGVGLIAEGGGGRDLEGCRYLRLMEEVK